uniref:Uncharacterized protein n=1 Tax=Chromera velia CCMP2878 TaxID=1169474 RepID=A0A0G4HSS4_9ALVE|eukprot:Cvel_31140.t1-p1 / transcript=Cvel_31140.t1 / gene=Cvel_31140 / organism=Chromera_velia_CCMP2878 / gene_product=hypothetical protein / transcript_product=hypothetical protein / location=Cvel_scaffold4580:1517-5078(-) / protein_length=586 / sequence_SO=supercontig / SO=protein_coding / is_pseudo=false
MFLQMLFRHAVVAVLLYLSRSVPVNGKLDLPGGVKFPDLGDLGGLGGLKEKQVKGKSCFGFACPEPLVPVLNSHKVKCGEKGKAGGDSAGACGVDTCCRQSVTVIYETADSEDFDFQNIQTNGVGGKVFFVARRESDGANFSNQLLLGSAKRTLSSSLLFSPTAAVDFGTVNERQILITDDGRTPWISTRTPGASGTPGLYFDDTLLVPDGATLPDGTVISFSRSLTGVQSASAGKRKGRKSSQEKDDAALPRVFFVANVGDQARAYLSVSVEDPSDIDVIFLAPGSIGDRSFDFISQRVYAERSFENFLLTAFQEPQGPGDFIVFNGAPFEVEGTVVEVGNAIPASVGAQNAEEYSSLTSTEGPTGAFAVNGRGEYLINVFTNPGGDLAMVIRNGKVLFESGVTCFEGFPGLDCDAFRTALSGISRVQEPALNEAGDWALRLRGDSALGGDAQFLVLNGKPVVGTTSVLDLDGDGTVDLGVRSVGIRYAISERNCDGTVDVYATISFCQSANETGFFDDCTLNETSPGRFSVVMFTVQVAEPKEKDCGGGKGKEDAGKTEGLGLGGLKGLDGFNFDGFGKLFEQK